MILTFARLRRPLFIGCFALVAAQAANASTVVCPTETFPSPDPWRAWVADAAAGHASVEWLQEMLDNHGTDLIAVPDGGLISLRQAVATLPAAARAGVANRYAARFDADAEKLLGQVRSRPDHGLGDLYAVAVRYPLSTVASTARSAAAGRALDQGDVSGARALAIPGDAASVRLAALPPANPPFVPPFAADWYAKLNNFGEPRVIPVTAADVTYTTGERGTLANRSDGTVLWRTAATGLAVDPALVSGTGRGPLCVPAVLSDGTGRAQLVVVRDGANLTAYRASDGHLFWTSAGDPAWAGLSVLGPPTVDGRLALVVALSMADADTASLQLVAADVTDGHPVWRANLGTVSDPVRRLDLSRFRMNAPEPFRDAPTPTVAGDLVIVPDNGGAVVAVDRFGGDVRWVRPYPPATMEGNPGRRIAGIVTLPPLPRPALLRWSAAAVACGDVVCVAPQDAAPTWGLHRMTGAVLWQTSALPDDATCAGVVDGRFVLGGEAVTFVDPTTGVAEETWTAPRGEALTGPPTVRDGKLSVQSTAGVLHPQRAGR